MNLARPVRCLFCSFSRAASTSGPRVSRRQFHLTASRFNDDQKNLKNLHQLSRDMKPGNFQPYTEEEKAALRQRYTPEQIAAIEAGEEAIDPKDLAEQFAIRNDPMKLHYLDDFSVIEPGVDKHVRAPVSNTDYNATLKSEEDFIDDFAKFFAEMPEDISIADWVKFIEATRVTKGKEENELNPNSSLVPDLIEPGATIDEITRKPQRYFDDGENVVSESTVPNESMQTLMKATGFTWKQISSLRVLRLFTNQVSNQTRLGKVHSYYAMAIAGNQDGLLGLGEGNAKDEGDAVFQAKSRAIRNMQAVPRYEKRTIFGDVRGKSGAAEVKLMSRRPGFGLRCQSLIYKMARAAGISDLAARVGRSRNPMNTVKAAYEALMSQRDPEELARARGKKLVDVRKVYYSGRSV